jgi:hypothetical protein
LSFITFSASIKVGGIEENFEAASRVRDLSTSEGHHPPEVSPSARRVSAAKNFSKCTDTSKRKLYYLEVISMKYVYSTSY